MTDFLFSEEDTVADTSPAVKPWKILIVDDEPDIHQVTSLVLTGFELEGAPLELLHAYSAKEAKQVLQVHPDIAVAFVDVVMESNHAGLELVQAIREELHNSTIRLVLRTGQPGEAPEEKVIRELDINDYKNKTELTANKLKTLMYATLRAYRDIMIIERHKEGLERIIAATIRFLDCNSIKEFASSVLQQVANVLGISDRKIMCCAATSDDLNSIDFELLAASGVEEQVESVEALPEEVRSLLNVAHQSRKSIHHKHHFVGFFVTNKGHENLLYVSHEYELSETDHDILEFFTNNIAVAYDNIRMREMVESSQRELSYILGEAVEKRSKETGSHVKRVANFSYLLGMLYGLSEEHAEKIRLASPLHDVGKIGIPDRILNKPGKLDADEWAIMQSHAQLGFDILSQSNNELLKLGAIIAHQHHENWDGSGYPQKLVGEEIDICGRITALADVFDALASERCYKDPWPMPDVLELLKQEKGKKFEPKLVDLLLDNLDQFRAIQLEFPDKAEST